MCGTIRESKCENTKVRRYLLNNQLMMMMMITAPMAIELSNNVCMCLYGANSNGKEGCKEANINTNRWTCNHPFNCMHSLNSTATLHIPCYVGGNYVVARG